VSNPTNPNPNADIRADFPNADEQAREKCARCGQPITYQGWPNFETWSVALWIDNDQQAYDIVRGIVARAVAYNGELYAAADTIKDLIESEIPPAIAASMFGDLITHALARVDWYRLAEAHMPDDDDDD